MKNIQWDLHEAIGFIRTIQPACKRLGYHVALAGGVLNKSYSTKDLDLVFLPLTNDKAPDTAPLMTMLVTLLGQIDPMMIPSHDPNPYSCYREQWVFPNNGKRIDAFIA
jgi:hypothetical protein